MWYLLELLLFFSTGIVVSINTHLHLRHNVAVETLLGKYPGTIAQTNKVFTCKNANNIHVHIHFACVIEAKNCFNSMEDTHALQ